MIPNEWKLDQTELSCAKSDGHASWIESIGFGSGKVDNAMNPVDLISSAELRVFIDIEIANAAAKKAAVAALRWALKVTDYPLTETRLTCVRGVDEIRAKIKEIEG